MGCTCHFYCRLDLGEYVPCLPLSLRLACHCHQLSLSLSLSFAGTESDIIYTIHNTHPPTPLHTAGFLVIIGSPFIEIAGIEYFQVRRLACLSMHSDH
jgi:hypothetical protein